MLNKCVRTIWSVAFPEMLIKEQFKAIVIFYLKFVRFINKMARFRN